MAVPVGIAVTVGATLFAILPHRLVEAMVALLILGGAIFAFRDSVASESAAGERATRIAGARRTIAAAFVVIFLAEWGDLTQVLTATLAAHYQAPLAVAAGAGLALWTVPLDGRRAGRRRRPAPRAVPHGIPPQAPRATDWAGRIYPGRTPGRWRCPAAARRGRRARQGPLPTDARSATLVPLVAAPAVPAELGRIDTGIRLWTSDCEADHDALLERAADAGEIMRWPGVPPMFSLRDPDGNTLCVVEQAAH